jgi:16S rRNA (guanine(527)-N(7))-methyltransferase RsmG
MAESFRSLLAAQFARHQILSETELRALEWHYTLLCKWNKKINLWRVHSLEEAVTLHYCESLYLARFLPAGPLRIADVGSGAGFPGFPIAVIRPESTVDLIESDQRKAAFLREARGGLRNLTVIVGPAGECTEQYDWIVSRAVRKEVVLAVHCAPKYAILSSQPSPVKLPWGTNRYIETFHVKHT